MENEASAKEPSAALAATIAARTTGCAPLTVSRFTTGARHYVYEARFADRAPIVVRIGGSNALSEIAGAIHLSKLLRPRGAPLPAILAEDAGAEFPWMVLARLPGVDLGDAIASFSDARLDRIAAEVARTQSIAAQTGSAGRYGYAIRPEQAPHAVWSQVLDAHLDRSRRRMASAGLFDVALADIVQAELALLRAEADAIPAKPFLHDTTTKNVIVTPEGRRIGNRRCRRSLLCLPALCRRADLGRAGRPWRSRSICLGLAGPCEIAG